MTCNLWRVKATKLLREGYGIEDIALKLSIPPADVRLLVRALRASGRLTDVLFGRRHRGEI